MNCTLNWNVRNLTGALTICLGLLCAATAGAQSLRTPEEVVVEFGKFFDLLVKDRDGTVPLTDMIDAHCTQDDPKAARPGTKIETAASNEPMRWKTSGRI
jgi:hypothetical protein